MYPLKQIARLFFLVLAAWPGTTRAREDPVLEQTSRIIERQKNYLEGNGLPWLSKELSENIGPWWKGVEDSHFGLSNNTTHITMGDRGISTSKVFLQNNVTVAHTNGRHFLLTISARSVDVLRQKAGRPGKKFSRASVEEHIFFGEAFGMPDRALSRFEVLFPSKIMHEKPTIKTFYRFRLPDGKVKGVSFAKGQGLQNMAEKVIHHR